jgi:hypothetical protein
MKTITCQIERTSGREPGIEGAVLRQFTVKYPTHELQREKWCLTFDSTDAFFEWLRKAGFAVVLTSHVEDMTALDGGPVPEWEVEIYDDYRE